MSTITALVGTDGITTANSMTKINTNFSNLNADKIETSTLDTDTSLAANSDSKIATQKAVKTYIDTSGGANASTTVRGIVEEATAAEITAGTATGATGARLYVNPNTLKTGGLPVVNTYTSTVTSYGNSSTQFDITNPSGTTFRYTYDGVGADPTINTTNFSVGAVVQIGSNIMSANNTGSFLITGSGSNYFEITNATGVSEINKTLSVPLRVGKCTTTWTKPDGLKYAVVEVQGGGGQSSFSSSNSAGVQGGGGGGYCKKTIPASSLGSTETIVVGIGGGKGISGLTAGIGGYLSSFGSIMTANTGAGSSTSLGGTATGGDINIQGGAGGKPQGSTGSSSNHSESGRGGTSVLSMGVDGRTDGQLYGGGAGGGLNSDGNYGAEGVVIVTEYYV